MSDLGSAASNVLIVVSSTDRRGAELEGSELADELEERGLPTRVVALRRSSSATALSVPSMDTRALSLRGLRNLRREIRRSTVVIGYGSKTLPAVAIAGVGLRIPFVYRSIGDPAKWTRGRFHRFRTSRLFARADRVVALWPEAGESIQELYRVPASRISSIPNARSETQFRAASPDERQQARERLGLPAGGVVVALIGALSAEKRPMLAIEAVTRVPNAVLVIAGDGSLRHEIEQVAVDLPTVRLLGQVPNVAEVLHASDLLLSTSSTEGMPGAILEAMLCAVPVVATDVGATGVLLGDAGRLLPSDTSAESVVRAIGDVLRNAHALAEQGRHRALGHYTWHAVAEQWVEVLSELAGPFRPPGLAD